MDFYQWLFTAMSAIILFIYGLNWFSAELQSLGNSFLKKWLTKATSNRLSGFFLGAAATSLIQSSSAVTSLTTGLVDAAVIPFRSSLGVLLGANVGTTTTAWLVTFKLTGIGPFFIVFGALLSLLPIRASIGGKGVFYFGFILFALDLISSDLKPLQHFRVFRQWLLLAEQPLLGAFFGMLITAVIQSSSVTIGIALLLVQEGLLSPEHAIPIAIGCNVGSTSTAMLSSASLGASAKATAVTNVLFNLIGFILFLPVLVPFSKVMASLQGDPAMAVAWGHLIFNLCLGIVFLPFLQWLSPWIERRFIVSKGEPTQEQT